MLWYIAIRGVDAKDLLHGDVQVEGCIGKSLDGYRVNESGYCPVNNCQAYLPVRKLTPVDGELEAAAFVAELVQAGQVYLLEVVN